ncbi:hypothetical protein CR513_15552, partial [Mucuna pruriens]
MTMEPKEGKRASLPIRVKLPELKSLKRFDNLLRGCRHLNFDNKVVRMLKVSESESELAKKRLRRNSVEGIPRAYLEERMEYLSKMGDWKTFVDVLGLSLFGIVLLTRLDNYMDHAAINAFWTCREKNKNHVVAILANTYYTLNNSHEGKEGIMTCSSHTLYLWITTHIFTSTRNTPCPIEDYKWCFVKILTDQEWA